MTFFGFDNKSFERRKIINKNGKDVIGGFYTPLGIGVEIEDFSSFKALYTQKISELEKSFELPNTRRVYHSEVLLKELGLRKAIPFCEQLLLGVQEAINSVYLSYMILTVDETSTVEVGGNRCPVEHVKTEKFLRSVQPYFAYVTAWAFQKKVSLRDHTVFIDGFKSKETTAWHELIDNCTPTIFFRGDECHELISTADMIAFSTDAKLWTNKLSLNQANIEAVWSQFAFETYPYYIDDRSVHKIKWYNNEQIDTRPYLAKPVIFLMIDALDQVGYKVNQTDTKVPLDDSDFEKPKKFKRELMQLPPYQKALEKANEFGGCVQFFDARLDSGKIRDGDIIAFVGEMSKKRALGYDDAFNITVARLKDIEKIKKEDLNH